jgi:hypothetical protein
MKKIIILSLLMLSIGMVALSRQYQIVDLFVCESGLLSAELSARSIVSRRELYRASYCNCEGVDSSLRENVRKGKWQREGFEYEYGTCAAPKNLVFYCICIGYARY